MKQAISRSASSCAHLACMICWRKLQLSLIHPSSSSNWRSITLLFVPLYKMFFAELQETYGFKVDIQSRPWLFVAAKIMQRVVTGKQPPRSADKNWSLKETTVLTIEHRDRNLHRECSNMFFPDGDFARVSTKASNFLLNPLKHSH